MWEKKTYFSEVLPLYMEKNKLKHYLVDRFFHVLPFYVEKNRTLPS